MTMPGWAADALADDVRAAADVLSAPALGAAARTLIADPAALATAISAAVAAAADEALADAVSDPMPGRPAIALTTATRREQAANRAAIAELLRELAIVRRGETAGAGTYVDRVTAGAARDEVLEQLDTVTATAPDEVYQALRELRAAAVAAFAVRVAALPEIIRSTPTRVAPSLALAYEWYSDLGRATEIAGRAAARRPGFIPARPIEVLSS